MTDQNPSPVGETVPARSVGDGLILDLFAGPGGWSEGLRMLGLADVGIEWDAAACRTRAAAGHLTIRADVAQYPPSVFAGKLSGLIASPPCQDFSAAGKRAGRTGEKGQLIDTVPEWVDALRPPWLACEQVPPALEVWEEFSRLFRSWGYSTWCGVLNAADFGVPQTRKRAILLASLNGPAHPPEPSHAKLPEPGLFGTRERWISMAAALGWDGSLRHPRGAGMVERHGERPDRPTSEPAMTVGSKARSWVLRHNQADPSRPKDASGVARVRKPDGSDYYFRFPADAPPPSFTGQSGHWAWERPSTTIVGSFSPDIVAAPGYRKAGDPPRQDTPDSVQITINEALTLQSFRPDYPIQGSRSKQFEQVGNAVPPRLAGHVIGALTGLTLREEGAA